MHPSPLILLALSAAAGPEPTVAESAVPVQRRALAATARMRAGDRATASAVVIGRKEGELYLLTADHAAGGPDATALKFEFFAD